jgi:hypothetical protein
VYLAAAALLLVGIVLVRRSAPTADVG